MVRRLALGLVLGALGAAAVAGQEQAPNRRDFTIVARGAKITFTSDDRPTSFAIDAYRIVKRAAGGQTITFEFRADQAGTFTFYCNLSDERCKDMKGTLVVKAR
jgi:plastocyanin